ncbi:disco-interacting protein 2 homolog C-like isoform X2 [Styela clava]
MDTSSLPLEIRAKLAELDLELSEGDITQKGYEKKKARLLEPFAASMQPVRVMPAEGIPAKVEDKKSKHQYEKAQKKKAKRNLKSSKQSRRDDRYRSDAHTEAVQQALAKHNKSKRVPVLPLGLKRRSLIAHNVYLASDESSDEDASTDASGGGEFDLSLKRKTDDSSSDRSSHSANPSPLPTHRFDPSAIKLKSPSERSRQIVQRNSSSLSTSSNEDLSSISNKIRLAQRNSSSASDNQPQPLARVLQQSVSWEAQRSGGPPTPLSKKIADIMPQILPGSRPTSQSLPPDVANITSSGGFPPPPCEEELLAATKSSPIVIKPSPSIGRRSDTTSYGRTSISSVEDDEDAPAVTKVSAKIQQLLNTLKETEEEHELERQSVTHVNKLAMKLQRPKKKPLIEYFQDDQEELEPPPFDENAPRPGGPISKPTKGEPATEHSNLPHSLEAAIHRCGTANPKAPCLTSVNGNGKSANTLTYGKLLSRMRKIAYTLTHKRGVAPGSRIALVFPNSDPISYVCTFYGCMLAGIVPVTVEVPMSSKDAGSSQLGFLLGNCGVQVALTCDACVKGLPKNEKGEIVQLKGWPKLQWILTDSKHLPKVPSNWEPTARSPDNQLAYIEYKTGKNNSVVGVAHSRSLIHNHCKSLVSTLCYNPGDVMINLLDFKRGVGLVHGLLASIFTGMHVFCIPYALMKHDPMQWLSILTKNKASLALVKSRDLHWTLAMHRENAHIDLKTLRMLLVSDAANPWSLGSSDVFLQEFERKGLRRDAVCPCAWSTEALTVAVRRPGTEAIATTISLHSLSFGVIQTEVNNQATSLMIQDVGSVFPGATIAVVRTDDSIEFCHSDEVGELLLCPKKGGYKDSLYFGLAGISEKVFRAHPKNERLPYIRTGLLGYVGPSGRVFVTGKIDGLLRISGHMHNADDIVATVLAVEPVRFVYRGRIAVFSINVLKDERLVIIVEQKPDVTEEECFKWMSSVIQAVDGIHGVGVYCLSLLAPNGLPKTPLGGVHLSETISRYLEGVLRPSNILMCPHQCVTNLPKPRTRHKDIGAASLLQGQVVTGVRLAEASGRILPPSSDGELDSDIPGAKKNTRRQSGGGSQTNTLESKRRSQFLAEILKWRAATTPDHVLFSQINSKGGVGIQLTCSQLHKKAEKVAQLLMSCPSSAGVPSLSTGDHVALMFNPGVDLIAGFYGCLYAGCIPVPIRPIHPRAVAATSPTVKMIVNVSKAVAILTFAQMSRMLKSKEVLSVLGSQDQSWPPIIDCEENPKKKLPVAYRPPTPELLAYLDFSVSTAGTLMGIKISHLTASQLCRSIKLQCELYPSRSIALCLDPYSGLSFALWCLNSIFSGHYSILIPPSEVETNPHLWLQVVSQYKVRDVYLTYSIMDICTKDLAQQVPSLKSRGISLSNVRTCVIVAEERPRIRLVSNFSKLYKDLGLSTRAITTSFGCRVNIAICLQGASCPDPSTVYVDTRSLRNDRVSLVEKGSPHSLCLMEAGKILPGTKVVIADCDTRGQCGDSRLGEVWVASTHSSNGYYAVYGGEADADYRDHFEVRLKTGDTRTTYCRTGYLGFLRRTELTSATGERHDALYVVGPLEETLEIRGMRYHPIDIENSVVRCSNRIVECAVFYSNNLLVVAVELDGNENTALDLVPLVTNIILEEQYLIAGVVAVLDPGSIPVNSRGEKQRMHLRDSFLQDKLDPIYVAYNM